MQDYASAATPEMPSGARGRVIGRADRIGDGDVEQADVPDDDVDHKLVGTGLKSLARNGQSYGRADGKLQRLLGGYLAYRKRIAAG